MRKILSIILVLAVVTGVILATQAYLFLQRAPSELEDVVLFEVLPGQSFKTVAAKLKEKNLVTSGFKFEMLARATGASGKIRVGEYAIRRNALPRDVLKTITSGKSVEYVISVPEGYNKYEIADVVEKHGFINRKDFLELCDNPEFIQELLGESASSLEGYLFPETYHVTKFTGAKGLIRSMVERFNENYRKVTIRDGIKLSRHELVTLASIIEKETGAEDERPIISSVFHNRMKLNMKLQTDPTVIYGIWDQTKKPVPNIRRVDLVTPTKYNTYTFTGLPYGPIANPGLEALQAAGNPAETPFLFFVSRNNGTHIFSQDYKQHAKAVGQFQVDAKAREGKSWRDLKKNRPDPSHSVDQKKVSAPKSNKKI